MSYDHPVHLFKAWQFFTRILPSGRLSGWSHDWAIGYPTGDLVPIGEEAWVSLFRLLTFGTLSWNMTYYLSVIGVHFLQGVATYEFCRRYFGRGSSTVAALFMMLDRGAVFQGGWDWHTYFGVWPITLGTSFTALTFAKIEDYLRNGGRRHLVSASCLFATSLIAHQICIIVFAIAVPLFVLDQWATNLKYPTRAWQRVFQISALGGGLAAFSVLPLISRGNLTIDRGLNGESLEVWAQKIVDFKLFTNGWPLISGLGFVGAIRILRDRHRGALFFVTFSGICFLIATTLPFGTLHIERVVPSLCKLELGRMVQVAKTFWFPLAAYGLSEVFRKSNQHGHLKPSLAKYAFVAIPILLALPYAKPVTNWIYKNQIEKSYGSQFRGTIYEDFLKLNQWADKERQSSHGFYRIAYKTEDLFALQNLSPMLSHTPVFRVDGPAPSHHFANSPGELDPELLRVSNVKYIVSTAPLSDEYFRLVKNFGQLAVYRLNEYTSQPFSLIGQGVGHLIRFERESIDVRVSNSDRNTRLRLFVANYDRWQATQNGAILPISLAPAYANAYPYFMEVPAQNGVVRFRYTYRVIDYISLVASLTSLVVLGLIMARPRWFSDRVVGFRLPPKVSRWLIILSSVFVIAIFASIGLRTQSLKQLLPNNSIFHQLYDGELSLEERRCRKVGDLDFDCSGSPVRAAYVSGSWGSHLCMTSLETTSAKIETKFPLRDGILAKFDPEFGSGAVAVTVNGESLGTFSTEKPTTDYHLAYFDTRKFGRTKPATVQITVSGNAMRCFDIQLTSDR
jgi:hypothetical protein